MGTATRRSQSGSARRGMMEKENKGAQRMGGSPFHCRRSIVVYYNVVYSITVLWYYSLMCINVVYSITVLWY